MKKKKVKYFPNDSYTGVFIRPRTVTKLRTLGQLRHRSVARSNQDLLYNYKAKIETKSARCNSKLLHAQDLTIETTDGN